MFRKKKFIIKKGRSKASGLNFKLYKGNLNESWVCTIESGWYPKQPKTGKTKMCGFTIGLIPKIVKFDEKYDVTTKLFGGYCMIKPTHWNSKRIAIQPKFNEKGVWNVYAYNYFKGVRSVRRLIATPEGTEFNVSLHGSLKRRWGYFCYPFYRGDAKSITDIKFKLVRA